MGPANVLDLQPNLRARWTSLTGMALVLDLGGAAEVDTVYLGAHNGTNAATVRIRAAASEAALTASPVYDSTALTINAATISEAWAHLNALKLINPSQTLQWWRFDFADGANPAGYFELGRLALAKAFRPAVNFGWGSPSGYIDNGLVDETVGGQMIPTPGGRRRVWELLFNTLSEGEAWGDLFEFDRLRGLSRDLIFAMNPDETTRLHQRLFSCLVRELSSIAPQYPGADGLGVWAKRYRIEELT